MKLSVFHKNFNKIKGLITVLNLSEITGLVIVWYKKLNYENNYFIPMVSIKVLG